MMKKIISSFSDEYDMLPRSSRVLCALSGGKDSVVLLHVLYGLSLERGFELYAAHFNHCLRGGESDRDEAFVKKLCGEMGVELFTGRRDVAAYAREKGLGIEEAARELRYAFLEESADAIGADRIATAHTADDNAETLLLNLARGSSLRGLCGIPPRRGRIVRPMLQATTAQVLSYAAENALEYVEDSTNALDDYSRNRIRHTVAPALREINPAFDENIRRCMSLLCEDERYLTQLADDFIKEHYKDNCLPVKLLAALPQPIAARVLQGITGGMLSYTHILAVLALASGERQHSRADVPGLCIRREYDRLIFGDFSAGSIEEISLPPGGEAYLEEAGLKISAEYLPDCKEINNSDNTFFFQRDSICGTITVRARKEGDSIRILGRNGTKTLNTIFS